MKIAAIQMDIAYGQPDINFQRVKDKLTEAASKGAQVAVLPEMWNTGFDLAHLSSIADIDGERTKELLVQIASETQMAIVGGSVATKKEDGFFNTMYVADHTGKIIAEYDKAHLFQLMDEHLYLQPGNSMNVFNLENQQMGGIICYDLRFPEWIRSHVLQGVKVMFVPAQWPAKRTDHWKVLLQARAIENQCFLIAVNRVGTDPDNAFSGNSMIIAPWGEIRWIGENKEMIHIEQIDLQEVADVRERIPVFQDRRPELYKYQ